MKNYLRILRYARPYLREVFWMALFNILVVFFSLGSVTILIPVLKILFINSGEAPLSPPDYQGILSLRPYLEGSLNYYLAHWSQTRGVQWVLGWILGLATLLFVLKNASRYLALVNLTYVKNGLEKDLRNAVHEKMLSLPMRYFNEQRKGDIISRLSADITEIQWAFLNSLQRLIQDPLMILSTLALLVIMSPQLTLFVIILIPVTGFVITSIGKSLKRRAKKAKEALGRLISHVEEHLGGLPIIQSYVAETRVQKAFEDTNHRHFRFMNQMLYRRELSSPVSEVLGSFAIIAIVWYGGFLILNQSSLQPEIFITYVVLFYQIINPAKAISTAFYDIRRGEASAARVLELMDTPNPLEDRADTLPKTDFQEAVVLRNLSFKYGEKWVLQDCNLTIPKGRKLALVGQSGSGKTTMAYLLNRFYDPTGGAIFMDGTDIRQFRIRDLRRLIGYISQDAVLFNDTIRNNLLMGNPQATQEEIENAARIAHAHDFILASENGYDTVIGDRGVKLSGGQRQRLTIARAILKNPPILILDEATSALDSESEKLVQEALEKLMANRTSIVIAHRLSTVQNADEIVVLKQGRIIEQGSHAQLIEKGGEYYKLVQLQAF